MMWCSECKTKYKKDFDKCPYCESPMTSASRDAEISNQKLFTNNKQDDSFENSEGSQEDFDVAYTNRPIEPCLLIASTDQFIVGLICNMLKENSIPFYLKQRGPGTYNRIVMGDSVFGVEIYVDKSNYETASDLKETVITPADETCEFTPLKDSDNKSYYWSKQIVRLFIILLGLITVIMIIVSFIGTTNSTTKITTTYSISVSG